MPGCMCSTVPRCHRCSQPDAWLISSLSAQLSIRCGVQADADRFWSEMANIAWCPVLEEAPVSCLPWTTAAGKLQPPRVVRMRADMWLVSSALHVLDADTRCVVRL